jgi:transcriptional regulator with XRE-family HTH domain
LGRWVRGETFPTYENLLILERIFGRPWEWFVVGDEGLKAMGALSPRDPIIIEVDERTFAIAMYLDNKDTDGISVYRVKHAGMRSRKIAATYARRLKDEQKL